MNREQSMIEFIIGLLNGIGNVDDGVECVLNEQTFESLCNLVGSIYGDMVANRVRSSFIARANGGFRCIMENCGDEAFYGVIPNDDID